MAIADYLRKLVELKNQLVANLNSMGVAASTDEKLNTLVPKVLECKTEQNVEWIDNPSGEVNNRTLYYFMKKIVLPCGITSIPQGAFNSNSNLTSITIPNSVTSIGQVAFGYCENLTSITIPDSVITLGSNQTTQNGTFIRCYALKSIIIPNSVTLLGYECFRDCNNLADIYYKGTEEEWNSITKGSNWNYQMGSSVSGGTTIHYNYVPE